MAFYSYASLSEVVSQIQAIKEDIRFNENRTFYEHHRDLSPEEIQRFVDLRYEVIYRLKQQLKMLEMLVGFRQSKNI